MTTVNLSLTSDQLKWIDSTSAKLGFANRSEFVRNILRFLATQQDLLARADAFPFDSPPTKDKKAILQSFANTKKYSAEFLKDLEKGLNRSDYFK